MFKIEIYIDTNIDIGIYLHIDIGIGVGFSFDIDIVKSEWLHVMTACLFPVMQCCG